MLLDVTAPRFESASTYVAGRRETSTPVALRTPRFDVALYSARGRNYREFNEDAAVAYTDHRGGVYAAVFDQAGGLGGRVRGDGSDVAARAVSAGFARLAEGELEVTEGLTAAFGDAHQQLRARGEREVSTAVALVARGEVATLANLGDSGALHLDVHGAVLAQTPRHRFSTFQGHNDLTHALGRFDWRPPDVVRWTVAPGEWLLLGTDGFLDNLGDDSEVSALIGRAASASELVTSLVDRALDAMVRDPRRGDNLSVVALRALAATESALHRQSPAEREST